MSFYDKFSKFVEDWKVKAVCQQKLYNVIFSKQLYETYDATHSSQLRLKLGFSMFSSSGFLPEDIDDILLYNYGLEQRKMIDQIHNKIWTLEDGGVVRVAFVFLIALSKELETSTLPIFRVHQGSKHVFMDSSSRVYSSWEDFRMFNDSPKSLYCFPEEGFYGNVDHFTFAELPERGLKRLGVSVLSAVSGLVSDWQSSVSGVPAELASVRSIVFSTAAAVTSSVKAICWSDVASGVIDEYPCNFIQTERTHTVNFALGIFFLTGHIMTVEAAESLQKHSITDSTDVLGFINYLIDFSMTNPATLNSPYVKIIGIPALAEVIHVADGEFNETKDMFFEKISKKITVVDEAKFLKGHDIHTVFNHLTEAKRTVIFRMVLSQIEGQRFNLILEVLLACLRNKRDSGQADVPFDVFFCDTLEDILRYIIYQKATDKEVWLKYMALLNNETVDSNEEDWVLEC